jgi:hypothetical protein
MHTEQHIPLSRSELLEMRRWIRSGWIPDESTIERITDSLVAIVLDSKTGGRGRDRLRVRAARVLLEMEIADVKRHNAAVMACRHAGEK